MTLDDLLSTADPAHGRTFAAGTVEDARRLIDRLDSDQPPPAKTVLKKLPRHPSRIARVLVPACAIMLAGLITILASRVGHSSRTRRPVASSVGGRARSPRLTQVGLGPNRARDRALIAHFGILRQPQTATARAFNTNPKLGGRLAQHTPFIPALTRAVQLPHHVTLYFYIAQKTRDVAPGYRHDVDPGGLGVELRAPFQGFGYCCQGLKELETPIGPQTTPYTMSQHPDWLYFDFVPDNVRTVRWTFPSNEGGGGASRTVTIHVHDNIAAVVLPHPGPSRSGETKWYSADGRLIGHHGS